MEHIDTRKWVKAAIALIIALISMFVVAKYAASAEFHSGTIAALDEKKKTVMELTAASTAASAAITLIPGDTATPIAEKLTDMSTYFLIVICAIYLEKYLVTITGYAAFQILIPLACLLYLFYLFTRNHTWLYIAKKVAVLGIAIFLVIPASIKVSELIETTYQDSIQETIESAEKTTGEIESASANEKKDGEQDEGLLSGLVSKVKDGVSGVTDQVENVLNRFIEALAVLIVTSCLIPVVVLLFFVWLVRVIIGTDIPLPQIPRRPDSPRH